MSLPKRDVKLWLDADVHSALKAICAAHDVGLGQYIEQLVTPHVRKVVHETTLMADEFRRSGIDRNGQESPANGGFGDAAQ